MLLIGENIHIISKKTRKAVEEKDEAYIRDLALRQQNAGMDYIDLNIGPARRKEGTMEWLINTLASDITLPLSLDTTNINEMESGLKILAGKATPLINSTSGDPERLDTMMPLAAKYNANIIALTMNNVSGIPKDPDGRIEIGMEIVEKAMEYEVDNERIFLDPLVLPIAVAQDQAIESLNSIRVIKESFDPPVKTTLGLSNVSNSAPKENRSLLNRVFLVLAMGCGLDSAIVDAFDIELKQFVDLIKNEKPQTEKDKLVFNLYSMMKDFGELEDVYYNADDPDQVAIYKTAQVILNKFIYAHNYLNI